MNYDIKIKGEDRDDGRIEFDRLARLAKTTKEIAQKALMLKLFGYSGVAIPAEWKKATHIYLETVKGSKSKGTTLTIDAAPLATYRPVLQRNAFKPELETELQTLTPMALVIQSFRQALVEDEPNNNSLDKPLLKSLMAFKNNFQGEKEVFYLSNRKTIPDIEVRLSDFKKIEQLEESIPEPHKIVVTGRLDEMKYSKSRLVMITNDGPVNILVKDNQEQMLEDLKNFFGKEFSIQGMANYRAGGSISFIELLSFGETSTADQYFNKLPSGMTSKQQLLFQAQKTGTRNPLFDIAGQWPGEETDAEFDEIIKSAQQ